ncbi:hypothetical protein D4R75_06575 [bacterium]|nr:MAG: hypothetical protein D4R75_06575 [bacterium]
MRLFIETLWDIEKSAQKRGRKHQLRHEVTPPERVAGWQDTKRIFEFSSLSRTFVTWCLGGTPFPPALQVTKKAGLTTTGFLISQNS